MRDWTGNEALLPSRPLGARLSRHIGRQQGRLRAAPFFLFLRTGDRWSLRFFAKNVALGSILGNPFDAWQTIS